MKLLHTLALVAVFIVLADNVVPIQGSWYSWSPNNEKKDDLKVKSLNDSEILQKDEEVIPNANEQDDEKLIEAADRDYTEGVNNKLGVQSKLEASEEENNRPVKYPIVNDDTASDGIPTTNIDTIHELHPQANSQVNQSNVQFVAYDRNPQQSQFVDGAPHPTVSHEMDPRFASQHRRSCQDNQYLCQKATEHQEHVRCIPNEWKCNGVRDCENNDDEEGCAINNHRMAPNSCNTPNQYTCFGSGINGLPAVCIDIRKLCDGTYDCSYGDDEAKDNCAAQQSKYATRREDSVQVQPVQVPDSRQPEARPTTQNAPTHYTGYEARPAVPVVPQSVPCHGKSDVYVKRLEWTDRCIRTCLSRTPNNYK